MNTYRSKWDVDSDEFSATPLSYHSSIDEPLRQAIFAMAQQTWRAVNARHYLRVDLRLDAGGLPRVLDVNPNPEISPGAGICRAVQEAAWDWREFLQRLVEWA